MSGGTFNYAQDRIEWEIAERLWQEIVSNKKPDEWELESGTWEGQRWTDDTIVELNKAMEALRRAYVYAQRIDWLLAGDDGEDTFHRRLRDDMKNFHFRLPYPSEDET